LYVMRFAFERGVLGFVPKTASPKVLLAAIELVMCGGKYIPQEMLATMATVSIKQLPDNIVKSHDTDASTDDLWVRFTGLTARQQEVTEHLLMGRSNKEIARIMAISPGTVRIHISAILRVLKVESRTKAVWLLTKKLSK